MTYRTMRFPGSFVYYLLFGGYLLVLAFLERSSSCRRKLLLVEKLQWTDLSAYLTWIMRHLGLPSTFAVALEARLLGQVGVIEPRMSAFMKTRRGQVFVDIGAYHGHYSLLLSRNFKQIIAIEPLPRNADFLRRVVNYRKAHNIRILEMAASAQAGHTPLLVMPQMSESRLESQPASMGATIIVETVTLDSILLPFDEVDLMKLDVEGAEFDVVEGAKDSMSKIRSWLIELHDQAEKRKLESYLSNYDYHLLWLDQGHLFASRRLGGQR